MQLNPTELERVAIMQQFPLRYFERRIEHAAVMDDRHYAMTVTQQFTLPKLGSENITDDSAKRPQLVPLGWFAKDRLPNIEVLAEDGSALPFLKRGDQGKAGAALFVGEWKRVFFTDLCKASDQMQLMWRLIRECAEQVLTSRTELRSILEKKSVGTCSPLSGRI